MKVIFDYRTFKVQKYGGVSRLFSELAKESMTDPKVDIRVVAGYHGNEHLHEVELLNRQMVKGYYGPFKLSQNRAVGALNQFYFEQYAKRWSPDLCHFTMVKYLKLPPRTKTVMTIHDMVHELFPVGEGGCPIFKTRKKNMSEKIDGIICVSENTKRDMIDIFGVDMRDKPIKVIYNGNALEGVLPSRGFAPEYPYYLFVGGRGMHKNFPIGLHAFAQLIQNKQFKDQRVVCFGGGVFTHDEQRLIHELGLNDKVVQLGGSDSNLVELYSKSVAHVYPSRYEGFGIPPLEAMSVGCPVIASNASSIPEVVGNGGLLFDPFSVEELVSCMEVVNSDAERAVLIERGRLQAAKFSWERCYKETLEFYSEIVGK
jgi:glycosyltransferase involved in cell wall biosynthesis